MKPIYVLLVLLMVGCGGCSKMESGKVAASATPAKYDRAQVELFELSVEGSKLMRQRALERTKLDADVAKMELQSAVDLEQAVRRGGIPKDLLQGYVVAYVADMRAVIAVVRARLPDQKPWADEMEPLLAKLEAAAR